MPYREDKNPYSMVVSRSVVTLMTLFTNNRKPAEINTLRLIMMVMIIQFNSPFIKVLV
jgi:hypothetical protein